MKQHDLGRNYLNELNKKRYNSFIDYWEQMIEGM